MGKTKILIVEDEQNIAETIQDIIEGLGYETIAIVNTGEDAVQKVKEGNVDLVLMDIVLSSEMLGTEAADLIWSQFNVPIIFLTGYLNKSLLENAKISEPFGYILKPFNERELYAVIEIALYKFQIERKTARLNSLLKTARNIGQLVNKEDKIDKLIKKICKAFTASEDVIGAWIMLIDDLNNVLTIAEDGLGKSFKPMEALLNKIEFPVWIRKILLEKDFLITEYSKNVLKELPFLNESEESISVRIEAKDKIFGILNLVIANHKLEDEEVSLLKSIVSDIAFALSNLDIRQKNKLTEEALVESERRYRQFIKTSLDAIIIHKDGKIIFANDTCLSLLKASNEIELLNKKISDFLLFNTSSFENSNDEKKELKIFLQEQKLIQLDGSIIDVTLSSSPIVFQNESCDQIVIRDITERKRIEEELKKGQRQVNILLDSLPGYAFFKDINCRYIIANQKFCDSLNCTKDEIIGKTDYELVSKEEADKYHAHDLKTLQDGEMLYISEEQRLRDGSLATIDTRKVPIKDDNGKVSGLIGLSFDATERKASEEAIKRYSKELEESNASKDKFFSIISHDLRSPFQGLLGLANIVTEEYDNLSVDELKEFLFNINSSAKNLFNLIENLLQWSRIQRGKIEIELTKNNLYSEVHYNVNLLTPNAISKNISLICEVDKNIDVYSDSNAFNSVLQNLISNAIKFTKPGGKIKITSAINEKFVELTISDTGVGIPDDIIPLLFRIDNQHSTLGTNKESGTGLGLVICKELVEMQGGKIWVSSKKNHGTSFTFTLLRENVK